MKVKVFRILSVLLLLSLMVFIFILSGQNATQSAKLSDGFSFKLLNIIYPKFKTMTQIEKEELIAGIIGIIRKFAHFTLYFTMGIFSFCTFISYTKYKWQLRVGISFVICVLYSISDEIHQLFSFGRSCELRDVMIDSSGALLSIGILTLFCFVIKKIRKKVF